MELATKINHPVGMKGGNEIDAFSPRSRKVMSFEPGRRAGLKRKYWKRARKAAKAEVGNEVVSWDVKQMAAENTP